MAKLIRIHSSVILAVFLSAPVVMAQETDPAKNDPREQPLAPLPAPLPAGKTSVLALNSPLWAGEEIQSVGNDQLLSSVQAPTLGPVVSARNFLVPSFSATSQLAMSSSGAGFAQPTDFNYLLGSLDLSHASNRSELLVHYTGGGMFSSYLNSAIQDLEFSYTYKWQRWSLLLGEDVSFLSESPFGFGGVGGLEFLSGNSAFGPGGFLNGILGPNQTIPTIMVPAIEQYARLADRIQSQPACILDRCWIVRNAEFFWCEFYQQHGRFISDRLQLFLESAEHHCGDLHLRRLPVSRVPPDDRVPRDEAWVFAVCDRETKFPTRRRPERGHVARRFHGLREQPFLGPD